MPNVDGIVYADYFGLTDAPFSVTPDPRFFYANSVYEEAFANLSYGIRARKGFVMLTGEVGTGKTTLLRRLIESLESDTAFVLVFNTRLDFDEILSFICDELEIRVPGPERLRKIQALNEFLLAQLRRGATTALLVDEAQNLTDDTLEELRLLSNLETKTEKLLQIVLVGQPELDAKIDRENLRQIRQRIALRCRLDRLKPQEVGEFIRHRLKTAGYTGGELFTPEAIWAVARHSRGIPRLVNVICDNALLIAYASSRKTLTAEMIGEVVEDLRLGERMPDPGVAAVGLERAIRTVGVAAAAKIAAPQPPPKKRWWFREGALALALLVGAAAAVHASSCEGTLEPWTATAEEHASEVRAALEPLASAAADGAAGVQAALQPLASAAADGAADVRQALEPWVETLAPGFPNRSEEPWSMVPEEPVETPVDSGAQTPPLPGTSPSPTVGPTPLSAAPRISLSRAVSARAAEGRRSAASGPAAYVRSARSGGASYGCAPDHRPDRGVLGLPDPRRGCRRTLRSTTR